MAPARQFAIYVRGERISELTHDTVHEAEVEYNEVMGMVDTDLVEIRTVPRSVHYYPSQPEDSVGAYVHVTHVDVDNWQGRELHPWTEHAGCVGVILSVSSVLSEEHTEGEPYDVHFFMVQLLMADGTTQVREMVEFELEPWDRERDRRKRAERFAERGVLTADGIMAAIEDGFTTANDNPFKDLPVFETDAVHSLHEIDVRKLNRLEIFDSNATIVVPEDETADDMIIVVYNLNSLVRMSRRRARRRD